VLFQEKFEDTKGVIKRDNTMAKRNMTK